MTRVLNYGLGGAGGRGGNFILGNLICGLRGALRRGAGGRRNFRLGPGGRGGGGGNFTCKTDTCVAASAVPASIAVVPIMASIAMVSILVTFIFF